MLRCAFAAPVPHRSLPCLAPLPQALHQRLEPLLLFTIDGANFIDDHDRQWELLLPVARAADGGCMVVGGGAGVEGRGVGRGARDTRTLGWGGQGDGARGDSAWVVTPGPDA